MKLFVGKIEDKTAILTLEESHHAQKVLRMKIGDTISVTNGLGTIAHGNISRIGKEIIVDIQETTISEKPKTTLHIAIAPTKNIDRFEFFVEKATELGITTISPLLTKNSERKIINQEKLQKQAIAASKQSCRSFFPKIEPLTKWKDFLDLHKDKRIYICHCDYGLPRKNINEIEFVDEMIFLIGPEGDFSKEEIEEITKYNKVTAVTLGNNRLRTETAGIYVSSCYYERIS